MKDMANKQAEIARLDGYLAGVVDCDRLIRERSGIAFELPSTAPEICVEHKLALFFEPRGILTFGNSELLEGGMRAFEQQLVKEFLQLPLGIDFESRAQTIRDRRNYMVLRVMDQIEDIMGFGENYEIKRLNGALDTSKSSITFFSISNRNLNLVIQFNLNKE
jgi:hypothetical protein